MPRPLRALDPDAGPLQRFAQDLRELRAEAGGPTYRELAGRTRFSLSAISEAARGERLPSLDVALAYVDACGGDRDAWTRRWHEVGAALAAAADGRAAGEAVPYRGLAAYEAADAGFFFGRERLLDELLARLADRRFLAVFGPSGVGKSSLLRAGLVPAVRAGRLDGVAPVTLVTAPGQHPPERLAAAEGLLVVDQFEEVFSACSAAGERQRFIAALLRANRPGSGLRVVLGVRADFFGHFAQHAELAAAVSDASLLVGPMTAQELRNAIVKPAARAGLSVDPALVATVVRDAGDEPGALPLLSHVLRETWRLRRGKHLTLAGYHAAGGLHGAVARTAERVYGELAPAERDGVRRVCLRMVAPGVGTDDTGRPVRDGDLPEGDRGVVERLVGARLLTRDGDGVRLAHEALLRSWPRLREWVAAERDGLRLHRELTEAAAAWEELSRDPGALWRGARLALAREWAPGQALTPPERSFLDASVTAERAERAAEAGRARQLRVLSAVLALLLAAAVAAGGLAWQQREDAVSRQLAAEATGMARLEAGEAARRALAAYEHAPTMEARSALLSLAGLQRYQAKLTGHAGLVKSVAFSPDGRVLASGGQDRTVRLWDVASGSAGAVLRGHAAPVRTVAFSPDGRTLASGDRAGRILLWDAGSGRRVRALAGHAGTVDGVAFSPDGRRLASAGADGKAVVWDPASGQELRELDANAHAATEVALTNRLLAVAGRDGEVAVWDLTRPEAPPRVLPVGEGTVYAVAFSPDGGVLAAAGEDRVVTLWDPERGTKLAEMVEHTKPVRHLAFADAGRTLVSAGYDDVAVLWDVERAAPMVRLTGHASGLYGVAATADGEHVASAGEDGAILLWDRARMPLTGHTDRITDVEFAPGGDQLASGDQGGMLLLWDQHGGGAVTARPRQVSDTGVYTVAYSPTGDVIATSDQGGLIRLWSLDGTRPLAELAGHGSDAVEVAFSPDGRLLASAGRDGRVLLWDVATRELAATLDRGVGTALHPEFSPDGRLLAAGRGDGTVGLWDVATRKEVATLPTGAEVNDVAFSPDGRQLASGGDDGRLMVWNVARRSRIATLAGHSATIDSVAFSPDGHYLASGGLDRSVIVWDVAARERWATLTGHDGVIVGLDFSPDGTRLASSSGDHTIVLWPLDPEEAAARLRAQVP